MQIIITNDGSGTIYDPDVDETYHSVNGAVTESRHVFISAGFNHSCLTSVKLLEIGFGTGLNAILTWQECIRQKRYVSYTAVEHRPLEIEIINKLGYGKYLSLDQSGLSVFRSLHQSPCGREIIIDKNFLLNKFFGSIYKFNSEARFDLVYYDAFSPEKQPEMWSEQLFGKIFSMMNSGSFLTTYCAKGKVKRMLRAVGFYPELLPGAPGKREMIRAIK